MIVVLGGRGYIGEAFCAELKRRGWAYKSLSRRDCDYTDFKVLKDYMSREKPDLVINAAGFTGRPNVDACEAQKAETLSGNTLFVQAVSLACLVTGTPLGHVSSGCIYAGAKIVTPEGIRVERDLMKPDVRTILESGEGGRLEIMGFSEKDEPNFSFRSPPCSFYSGSKALAEEVIMNVFGLDREDGSAREGRGKGADGVPAVYLWRLRIPFDEVDNARNYVSKLQRYAKLYENFNSLSHRNDYVKACLDLWLRGAPAGVYNVTNPGLVSTRYVAERMKERLRLTKDFAFWRDDEEFYKKGAITPRSNCILDVSKLIETGVRIRPVVEALEEALESWRMGEEIGEKVVSYGGTSSDFSGWVPKRSNGGLEVKMAGGGEGVDKGGKGENGREACELPTAWERGLGDTPRQK